MNHSRVTARPAKDRAAANRPRWLFLLRTHHDTATEAPAQYPICPKRAADLVKHATTVKTENQPSCHANPCQNRNHSTNRGMPSLKEVRGA
jgi:hypothetical protein